MVKSVTYLKIAGLCFLLVAAVSIATIAYGFTVEFTWDHMPPNDLVGYKLYQSDVSGQYTEEPVAVIPVFTIAAVHANSFEIGSEPELAVDGNPDTYWHTSWSDPVPVHPHSIILTLAASEMITSLHYVPRVNGNSNGTIQDYAIYVTDNLENWGDLVVSGAFGGEGTISFEAKGKYLKLIALNEVNRNAWASAGEIELTVQPCGVVEGVLPGTHYWVCTAYDKTKESDWSNEVTATFEDILTTPNALEIKKVIIKR